MDDEERNDYMYYIHRWYRNTDPDDVVMTLQNMEKHIMSTFAARLSSLHDPNDPDTKAFYHDYMEDEGRTAKIATVRTFLSRTRLSLRRVLGCGHFILSLIYMEYNALEAKHGDDWPNCEFWREMKADLLEKELMNPEAPCDCDAVYQWLLAFYEQLFQRMPEDDETRENARIPFTMLQVKGPCERNADESSVEFMRNYQEFIVFYMHNMHELGILSGDPQQTQYYKLLRKRDDPAPESLNMSQKFFITKIKTTATYHKTTYRTTVNMKLRIAVARGAGQTQTIRSITNMMASGSQHRSQENRQDVTYRASGYWQRTDHFHESKWHHVTSGLSVKVINQQWRLGCKGCPKGPQQRRVTYGGRKRLCKWVTIKRTVLVRRMVMRRRRLPAVRN